LGTRYSFLCSKSRVGIVAKEDSSSTLEKSRLIFF
jgi:hypothetical protein